jgi:hypothetical protein
MVYDYKSTEYGRYNIANVYVWSINTHSSCKNVIAQTYGTYINGVYTKAYYTSTKGIVNAMHMINTNILYLYTTQSYTATSSPYSSTLTLKISYYSSYMENYLYTDCNILTDTNSMTYYTTDIQYSTITRIIAPSPSIVLKDKCTCILPLCNKIDLVLLTINNIV